MSNEITNFLKYANLQMAAEALWDRLDPEGVPGQLKYGNSRSSRFTAIEAQQFIDEGWMIVEHQSNTATGFSGTLFKNIQTGEQIFSLRSTEFADDAARDNQATNVLEIKETGWALGQIADMEKWFSELKASGKIDPAAPLSVTGYSLGGHLATAFNLLHKDDRTTAGEPLIASTYTFNGAGVGEVLNGKSLAQVVSNFKAHRVLGSNADLFNDADVLALYGRLKDLFKEGATVDLGQVDAEMQSLAQRGLTKTEELTLYKALGRMRSIVYEAGRINAGVASGGAGAPALAVSAADIAAVGLDYQLAVLRAGQDTQGYRTNPVLGGIDAYAGRNSAPGGALNNFNDLYGAAPPSAVANSQLHYGSAVPIFVEDQPLYRGTVIEDVGTTTLKAGEVKLLVDNFGLNDFGDTHSLVLIVDSLNVQNALAQLDPTLSAGRMNDLLKMASNLKADAQVHTQGKADGDTLESFVNALADTLGLGWAGEARLEGDPNGGTWARIEDKDGYSGRSVFYQQLKEITDSSVYKSLQGKVRLQEVPSTGSTFAAQATARASFADIAALESLSPFVLKPADAAGEAALDSLWQSGTWGEKYNTWLQDKALVSLGKPATAYTDEWLTDRSEMLRWQVTRNTMDVDRVRMPGVTESVLYRDVATATNFYLTTTNGGESLPLYTRHVTFGGSASDELGGADRNDRLYGGGGADTLIGAQGDDYLQGDAGNDTLDGGEGNDTLAGGAGTDTYVIGSDSGRDTLIDADDQGVIQLAGRTLTGTGELISTATAAQPYTVWLDDSNAAQPIRYSLNTTTQELTIAGAGSTVVVRNFSAGDLGISIPAAAVPVVVNPAYTFDLGTSTGINAFAALTPAQQNTNLRLDNAVFADARYLSVTGNAGDDIITGGTAISPSGTILNGGAGEDRIWAGVETTLQSAIDAGESAAPSGSATLLLAGDEGDDQLVGAAGDDILFGGTGDDILVGGAGSDIILADGDDASYQSDDAITAWSTGSNTAEGPGRWLRLRVHSARVGETNTDSTGHRLVQEAHIDQYINPLANTDLSGLLAMRAEDIVPDAGDTHTYLSGTQRTYAQVNGGKAMGTNVGSGADVVYAGAGDDIVNAGAGDDIVFAGSGIDAVAGYEGDDFIEGGEGADTLWGDYIAHANTPRETHTEFGATWTVKLELDPARHGRDTIDGGDGNDTIYGGGQADELYGGAGDDLILGDDYGLGAQYAGDDFLNGGSGNDELDGGAGSDELIGGDGDDLLFGDSESTTLADHGNDRLDGGSGDDYLEGGGGKDSLTGGAGNDTLRGDGSELSQALHGADVLDGGDGDDLLYGEGGDDILQGGTGNDTLDGGAGNNTYLFGRGDGLDVIRAASGSSIGQLNILQFGPGISKNDVDAFRVGVDLILSIRGTLDAIKISSFYLNGSPSNPSNPIQSVVFADGSTWRSSEIASTLQGSDANDRLYGTDNPEILRGGAGNDYLSGLGGNDELDGGAGNDELIGGEGDDTYVGGGGIDIARDYSTVSNDTYRYQYGDGWLIVEDKGGTDSLELGSLIAPGDVSVKINYTGGYPNDVLLTFKGNPSQKVTWSSVFDGDSGALIADRSFEAIKFSNGTVWTIDDIRSRALTVTPGDDAIHAFEGDDTIDGGLGNDDLNGKDGNDTLIGGAGNDSLRGDGGDDLLLGGEGDDNLIGMKDNDVLIGGPGTDRLNGYSGNDVYKYALGDGMDFISDSTGYSAFGDVAAGGFDRIELAMTPDQISDIELNQGDLTIVFSDGGSLTIAGMYASIDGELPLKDRVPQHSAIEEVAFADGTLWTWAELKERVATITGSVNPERLTGSERGESIYGRGANDVLIGLGGDDQLYGESGNDTLKGGEGDDLLSGGDGWDSLFGGPGNDTYIGGTGSDTYVFALGDGQDSLEEGIDSTGDTDGVSFAWGIEPATVTARRQGLDVVLAYSADDSVTIRNWFSASARPIEEVRFADGTTWNAAQIDALVKPPPVVSIVGTPGNDTLNGTSGNDTLESLAGNDTLDGGAGTDIMAGGAGNDLYVVDNQLDTVFENANEGIDTVKSTVSWTLGSNIEHLWLTGSANINATGNELDNVLTANAGDNILDGLGGIDRASYYHADSAVNVSLAVTGAQATGGSGTDTLVNIERLIGSRFDDRLTGSTAADVLDGSQGNDTLTGGAGNDTYVVDAAGDVVVELANEGIDLVQSAVSYTLTDNVENLMLNTTAAIDGTGNGLNNTLYAGAGNNVLDGQGGSDYVSYFYAGSAVTASLAATGAQATGGSGVDMLLNIENLYGSNYDDVLIGSPIANMLNGGIGRDTLIGGMGNDMYFVDNSADMVTELANEGTDLVQSTISYTLSANVENLTLTGTAAIDATGNALDNLLTGNVANNILSGGAGNDTLNGSAGADTMTGGLGNDMYFVDNTADAVIELAGEGTDTVRTRITHTLADNVENLMLDSTAAIDGTGNALGNVLYAGAGNNVLDGLAGNDWVSYVYAGSAVTVSLAATGAQATGGSGTDTLRNIEYLFGSNYNDILTGNSAANTLSGGLGNDTLIGGQGADALVGGAGNDTYRYRSGDGNDTVSEAGGDDTVELLDLNPGDVRIVQGLNGTPDLIVDALTGQSIALDLNLVSPGWSADGPQVEHLRFADGTVWNSEQMRAAAELERSVSLMVQAMATFSVPAPGLVTATALDDQSRLAPVLAASWG